jgi:hypothetical protein
MYWLLHACEKSISFEHVGGGPPPPERDLLGDIGPCPGTIAAPNSVALNGTIGDGADDASAINESNTAKAAIARVIGRTMR